MHSVPSVVKAFLMQAIVMCIFSILESNSMGTFARSAMRIVFAALANMNRSPAEVKALAMGTLCDFPGRSTHSFRFTLREGVGIFRAGRTLHLQLG